MCSVKVYKHGPPEGGRTRVVVDEGQNNANKFPARYERSLAVPLRRLH